MKINPTPINDPKLRDVMANFGTHKIMVCQHHPESQFSSKNPYQRSIFVLTTDCKCPVSDLLVIDDGRTAEEMVTNDILMVVIDSAIYDIGPITEQLSAMRARIAKNETYGKPALIPPPGENWMDWADYADIQQLDQLFIRLAVQEYAELYHKLASTYTEDKIMYQLNQYNAGVTW